MTRAVADQTGLSSTGSRLALVFVWGTGVVHGLLVGAFTSDAPVVWVAYFLAVVSAVAVTWPSPGRIPVMAAATVALCGIAVAGLVISADDVTRVVWLFDFACYPAALLIPRSRILIGGGTLGTIAAGGVCWSLVSAQPEPSLGRMISAPILAGLIGAIWLIVLRRIVDRESRARTESELVALRVAASSSAERTYRAARGRVAREAGPLLRAIAEGPPMSDGQLDHVVAVEGKIRDRILAAALAHPRVEDAVEVARSGGARVLLIGDGESAGDVVGDSLADAIIRIVSAAELESVTIRRLPPGRGASVSIVARIGGVDKRGALDSDGRWIDRWPLLSTAR